jgi:hypothetical protein
MELFSHKFSLLNVFVRFARKKRGDVFRFRAKPEIEKPLSHSHKRSECETLIAKIADNWLNILQIIKY